MCNEIKVNDGKEVIGTINFADIITDAVKDFNKIKSNTARLSNRKKERYCKNYNIRAGERILAYYKKSMLGMFLGGGIFTDKAFYCEPEKRIYINYETLKKTVSAVKDGDTKTVRIDYMDLCNYVVTRKSMDNSSSVGLCDETIFMPITYFTSFENILANEVYDVFIKLQSALIKNSKEASIKINEFMMQHYKLAKEEMKSGICTMGREMVIRSFVRIGVFPQKAIMLLAENTYRKCNPSKYEEFLEEFKEYTTEDFKSENMIAAFANRLIKELSDLSHEFSDHYLENAFNNLKCIDTSKELTIILVYICIRVNMHDFARERISVYEQTYGRDKHAAKMEVCVCVDGHQKMREVMDALKNSQNVPQKYYHVVDSIGFTPLHYAMIMENWREMTYMIASDILNDVSYILAEDIHKLFSYIIFAKLTHTNYSTDMMNILTLSEKHLEPTLPELIVPEIMSRYRENRYLYKAYDEVIKGKTEGLKEVRRAARRKNAEFVLELLGGRNPLRDEFSEAQEEKYRKYREYAREYEDSVNESLDEISSEIRENVAMLDEELKDLREKNKKIMKELRESNNPVIQFFFSTLKEHKEKFIDIFDKVDSLDHCRLYRYHGFLIVLPDSAEFEWNVPYELIDGKDDVTSHGNVSDEPIKRKYGDHWFSDEAHFDKEVLKTEYRILAKKYHPDSAKEVASEATFIEIHREYEEILKQL